jgi:hypothetical protein
MQPQAMAAAGRCGAREASCPEFLAVRRDGVQPGSRLEGAKEDA